MITRRHLLILAALVVAALVLSAAMYARLPDPTPIHWGLYGDANGFAARWIAALQMPIAMVVIIGLLLILPALGPLRQNMDRFRLVYGKIAIAIVGLMLLCHALVLLKAAGAAIRIEVVIPVVVGILLIVLGNWMGKIRRNFWVGIRTPWTLASDVVWERTHRVGGRLLVLLGVAVVAVALFGYPAVTFGVLVGGTILLVIWALLYSLWVYHHTGGVDQLS